MINQTGVELSREDIMEMNQTFRHAGFVVDVSFKRKGHYITVSPRLLGADVDNNEELKDFFKKHVKSSQLGFLDDKKVSEAENVSKATHKEKRRVALGTTGSIMTRDILNEFKVYLAKKTEEYYEIRDKLVAEYDDMVAYKKVEFRDKLIKNTMKSLDEAERDELVNKVFSRIPTKEEYHDSFNVTISTTKITLVDELDESEKDEALEQTIILVNEITGKNLGIAFDKLNKMMTIYHKNGQLNPANKRVLTSLPVDLKKRNLFNDSLVEDIIVKVNELKTNKPSDDELIEEMEILVSKMYGYAMELGVEDELNLAEAALSEFEMLDLYDMLKEELIEEIELDFD